jgi:hypothetical protein
MNSSQEQAKQIRRDFVFFVSGVPNEMMIRHRQSAFTAVGEDQKKIINKISECYDAQAVANWLRAAAGQFTAAIFRNEYADERDGFSEAFEKLSGILDGYAFLIEDTNLEVCPLVLVRERDEPDAKIKIFGSRAWISWGSPAENAEQAWQARRTQLLQRFLLFFETVANDDTQFDTEVVNQLGLSAKMFRHGRKSESYGIEFLCKFTALEGLVCGPREHGHGKLLKQRVSSLFRTRNGVEAEVEKLWKMRCEASHQGKAFSSKFSAVIEPLEQLTLGVMVFALDSLTAVKTIEELWDKAASYSLPPEVVMERPKTRVPVIHMIGEIGQWGGAGLLTDGVFKQLSTAIEG